MDQSARYVDLSLKEEDLIAGGKHVLCAYNMHSLRRLCTASLEGHKAHQFHRNCI